MKTKTFVLVLAAALAVAAGGARGATNEVSGLLQRGLFEEEANRNLEAAIQAYQAVVTQTDKDHQFAATAVFRLGECYRKLGRTNEANVQYERILREFADQPELVKLSEQQVGHATVAVVGPLPPQETAAQEELREIERVRAMIKDSPDLINAYGPPDSSMTPLLRAVAFDRLSLAEFLLDNKADIEARDTGFSQTALLIAAKRGNKPMVELLLSRGANIEAKVSAGQGGDTALHRAVEGAYKTVVDVLLAHGANINAQNEARSTALDLAVKQGFQTIAEDLLAHGADVTLKDNAGQTALHLAAATGNQAVAELLLTNKADVNAEDRQGMTPLYVAAGKGQLRLVRLFLAKGAEVNAADDLGHTPLTAAVAGNQGEIAELFLSRGADVNAQDNRGSTALCQAVKNNLLEMVRLVLAHQPKVDVPDYEGVTPFRWAFRNNEFEIAETLLAAGADPDVRATDPNYSINSRGVLVKDYTALESAVQRGDKRWVEMLLKHKADPNQQSVSGDTLIVIAKSKLPGGSGRGRRVGNGGRNPAPVGDMAEIVELLRKAGADENIQRRSAIAVSRASSNFSRAIFARGTNDVNRYSLYELVAMAYGIRHAAGGGGGPGAFSAVASPSLSFPDLTRLKISRLNPGTGSEEVINVDLETALKSGDCSKDVRLEWGDILEFPMVDHNLNETWEGFSKTIMDGLSKCLARTVEINCNGQSHTFGLTGESMLRSGDYYIPVEPRFRLRDVIYRANVLLASSDTSRVKVRRTDAETKKVMEMVFDLGKVDPDTDLWLRDGDVIEIPEKP